MSRESAVKACWRDMHRRCTDQRYKWYPNYGGRGIDVCQRWKDFACFQADMGERPPKHSLERVDNSKGYGPDNCRWATMSEQARNRRSNTFVEYLGERLTVQDWAKRLGTQHTVIRRRLKLWGVSLALTTPVTKRKPLLYRRGQVVPSGPTR